MSLRTATLLAAAGIAAGIAIGLSYNLGLADFGPLWLEYGTQFLMTVLFVMLYREMGGAGQARHRQDLAILATIGSGVVFHLTVREASGHPGIFSTPVRAAYWVVAQVILPLAWIAFLILLVKDAAPLRGRGMRIVAPVLAAFTVAAACWHGYFLFFRVGMAWLSISSQRSLAGLFWNLFLLPALELFRDLSMVVFLILLCKKVLRRETI